MIRKKHLHALTHKGSADDGKRWEAMDVVLRAGGVNVVN